jgi:hypothetical protein
MYALCGSYISSSTILEVHLLIKRKNEAHLNESEMCDCSTWSHAQVNE